MDKASQDNITDIKKASRVAALEKIVWVWRYFIFSHSVTHLAPDQVPSLIFEYAFPSADHSCAV
jgi:hypothetical protein